MIPLIAPLLTACAPLGAAGVEVPSAVVLGIPYDEQNPFAKVVRGEPSQPKVYEDRYVVAFMDYSPATPGHMLVISKTSKGRNLLEMSDRELMRVMHVARLLGRAAISGLGADGFTIEQNNAYSQSVPHLHVHVMPKYAGYSRCIGSGVRQPNEVLAPIAERVRAALKADPGQPVPGKPADNLPAPPYAPATPQRALYSDAPVGPGPAAGMAAFRLPSNGSNLNAVLYTAGGAGPHPTLLLLHGFPGNEQNLDLAQAARRAGWNVLTLHYRGSWGSPGTFSYAHCAEDAAAALAWIRANAARYNADPARIVVAGHSMGGSMAARVAASDPSVLGTALFDPWDIAATGRNFADPAVRRAFTEGDLPGDLPPLAGTSAQALTDEIVRAGNGGDFDLVAQARAIGPRPLLIVTADRGIGKYGTAAAAGARAGGGKVELVAMPTDHSFSDKRVALTQALVGWLGQFTR
jgi:diadenosine tetraphosphate (Ap4A) HIT family hydrolase/pimeloyl-ACP methyl ester carboxylesterase